MHRRLFIVSLIIAAATPQAGSTEAPAPDLESQFRTWLPRFKEKALAAGVPAEVVERELANLAPDPSVAAKSSQQPEFSRPIGDYIKAVVNPDKIALARQKRAENAGALLEIEDRTGVPAEMTVAIWGAESGYGKFQGDYDVIRSIATLAAEGRRAALFESELIAALKIIATGEASRAQLKGSWAGAMGQTQFEPSDYLAYAVDGDHDGRRDIWGSSADALASTANFLSKKAHWRPGESWAREVTLPPGFDCYLAETASLKQSEWAALGLKLADPAASWNPADEGEAVVLLLPAGHAGPAFLAYKNHYAIRAYNNSIAYALSVGLLADQAAGRPALFASWPAGQPLALADRVAAQESLKTLGFDPGGSDGVMGVGTRRAVREWQKARGLPPDGYLPMELIERLKQEAAAVLAPANGSS